MEIHFGWLEVSGHFFWVSGGGWGWVEIYFQWVGVGRQSYGWVEVCGGIFWMVGGG